MNISRKKIIFFALFIISFLGIIYGIYIHQFSLPLRVTLQVQVSHPDTFQLFYNTGYGYNEKESLIVPVAITNKLQSVVFSIPVPSTTIKSLRFDPGSANNSVVIQEISLETSQSSFTWKAEDLLEEFTDYFDIATQKVINHSLVLTISGTDPQFIYANKPSSKINLYGIRSTERKILYAIILIFLYSIIFSVRAKLFALTDRLIVYVGTLRIIRDRSVRITYVFIILLGIPLSQMIFQYLPEINAYEKRTLAVFPNSELLQHISTWKSYTQSFESFFNDHYGLRSLLIRTNSFINIKLFNVAPKSEIIIGKNDWLFLGALDDGPSRNFSDYYGNALFTADELATIKTNILNLQKKLNKQHTDLLFVLAANKQTIYGNYLPESVISKKGSRTRADQLAELAKEININYIDTRSSLLDAKSTYPYPLYYKTDTHWNELGSFVAYQQISKQLQTMGHRVSNQYTKSTPKISSVSGSTANGFTWDDLATYINVPGTLFKDNYIHVEKRMDFIANNNLRSNQPIVTTLPHTNFSKAVIFRDSFAIALIPYLSETFSRAVYVWDHTIDYNLINQEKPDIVIFEFVERFSNKLLDLGTQVK